MSLSRRHLLACIGASLLAPRAVAATLSPSVRAIIKPKRPKSGDLVGLIAPSGVMDDALIEKGVKNLESYGFKVKVGNNIRAARGGYAGTVAQRLDDLHGMFLDKDVKAIWAARGGSGCSALLPSIRYDLIRANPKVLVGYSDITALHLAIYRKARLVTFHGPVAPSTPTDYTVSQMQAVLMSPRPQTEINMSVENEKKVTTQSEFALRTFRHGVAEGRLIGGNLSVLSALIGTPYAAEIENHLVFLEDVREPPYRIDRMLTQLQLAGILPGAAAVLLGVFQKCEPPDAEPSLSLAETLDGQLSGARVPSVYGYSLGHVPHICTLPIGIRARLDTEARTVTLLESAVS